MNLKELLEKLRDAINKDNLAAFKEIFSALARKIREENKTRKMEGLKPFNLKDFVNRGDPYCRVTLLDHAACSGAVRILDYLFDFGWADANAENGNGERALELACYLGQEGAVDVFLAYKAEVHRISSSGASPLSEACRRNYISIVNTLMNADPHPPASVLIYALIKALTESHRYLFLRFLETGKKLLDSDSFVEICSTALQWTFQNNDPSIALKLLELGANPNGEVMIILGGGIKVMSFLQLEILVKNELVANALIDKGANISQHAFSRDNNFRDFLSFAFMRGLLTVLENLLEKGACFNSKDPLSREFGGEILLHYIEQGNEMIANRLIKAGADLNVRAGSLAPLFLALCYQHKGIVKELMIGAANENAFAECYLKYPKISKEKHDSLVESIKFEIQKEARDFLNAGIKEINGFKSEAEITKLFQSSVRRSVLPLRNLVFDFCAGKTLFNPDQVKLFLKIMYNLIRPDKGMAEIHFHLGCWLFGKGNELGVLFLAKGQDCEDDRAPMLFCQAYRKLLGLPSSKKGDELRQNLVELITALPEKEKWRVEFAANRIKALEFMLQSPEWSVAPEKFSKNCVVTHSHHHIFFSSIMADDPLMKPSAKEESDRSRPRSKSFG